MRSSFQILQKENIFIEILPGSEFNGDPVLVVVQHVLCSVSCVSWHTCAADTLVTSQHRCSLIWHCSRCTAAVYCSNWAECTRDRTEIVTQLHHILIHFDLHLLDRLTWKEGNIYRKLPANMEIQIRVKAAESSYLHHTCLCVLFSHEFFHCSTEINRLCSFVGLSVFLCHV